MADGGIPLLSVVDGLGTMAFPVVPHIIGFDLDPLDHDVRRHTGLVFGIQGLTELDPTLLWGSPEPRSEVSEYLASSPGLPNLSQVYKEIRTYNLAQRLGLPARDLLSAIPHEIWSTGPIYKSDHSGDSICIDVSYEQRRISSPYAARTQSGGHGILKAFMRIDVSSTSGMVTVSDVLGAMRWSAPAAPNAQDAGGAGAAPAGGAKRTSATTSKTTKTSRT